MLKYLIYNSYCKFILGFQMSYWVVGGHYTDTSFVKLLDGHHQEKYGPYSCYDKAKQHWDKLSWENVDVCNIRYTILPHK